MDPEYVALRAASDDPEDLEEPLNPVAATHGSEETDEDGDAAPGHRDRSSDPGPSTLRAPASSPPRAETRKDAGRHRRTTRSVSRPTDPPHARPSVPRPTPPQHQPQRIFVDLTAPSPPLPRPTVVASSSNSSRSALATNSSASFSRRNTPSRTDALSRPSDRLRRPPAFSGVVLPGPRPPPETVWYEISSDDEDHAPPSASGVSPTSASSQMPRSGADRDGAEDVHGWIPVSRRRRPNRDMPANPLDIRSPQPHAASAIGRDAAAQAFAAGGGGGGGGRAVGASVDPITGDYIAPHFRRSAEHRAPEIHETDRISSDESDDVIDLSATTQAEPEAHSITNYRIRNTNLAMPRLSPPRSKPPPIEHPLASTFTCPICLCQPVKASVTPCGHVFCGSCLFDALKTQAKQREANEAANTSMQGWGFGLFGAAMMAGGAFGGGNGGGGGGPGGGALAHPTAAAQVAAGARGRGRNARPDPLAGQCPVCRAEIKGGFGGIAKGGIVGIRLLLGKPVDDPRQEDGRMKGGVEATTEEDGVEEKDDDAADLVDSKHHTATDSESNTHRTKVEEGLEGLEGNDVAVVEGEGEGEGQPSPSRTRKRKRIGLAAKVEESGGQREEGVARSRRSLGTSRLANRVSSPHDSSAHVEEDVQPEATV
ncbi:hypothetical protein ACQY0O_004021 [Thecaphora frezii]